MIALSKYFTVVAAVLAISMVAFGLPQKPILEPPRLLEVCFEPCVGPDGISVLQVESEMTVTVNFPVDARPGYATLYFAFQEVYWTSRGWLVGEPQLWHSQVVPLNAPYEKSCYLPAAFADKKFLIRIFAVHSDDYIEWALPHLVMFEAK